MRRAFLLGTDPLTGKDYNHRRDWVIQRLKRLVANFAIDVGFVAVLSNHLHVVLRTDPRLVKRMGDEEVARRWLRVYPGKRVLDDVWIDPTDQNTSLIPAPLGSPDNDTQRAARTQQVISLTRSGATETQDTGSR